MFALDVEFTADVYFKTTLQAAFSPGATTDGVALSRSTKAPWPVSTESSKSPGLSGGAIAGIAIGCVVAVFCLVFAVKSWKQKRGGTEVSDDDQQTDDNPGVRYDTLNE